MGMLILVYISLYIFDKHALSALFWTHISVLNHITDMHGIVATMLFHWTYGCLRLVWVVLSWLSCPILSWGVVSNCFEFHLHKATSTRTEQTVSIFAHAALRDAQLRATVHDMFLTHMQLHPRVCAVLTHCNWNTNFGRCSLVSKSAVLKMFWKWTQV